MFNEYPYKLRDAYTHEIHGSFKEATKLDREGLVLDLNLGIFSTHYLIKHIKPKSPEELYSLREDLDIPILELITDNEIKGLYEAKPNKHLKLIGCKTESLLIDRPEGLVSVIKQMRISVTEAIIEEGKVNLN
jgi:hypothetical protein